jgi:hypothetical protein
LLKVLPVLLFLLSLSIPIANAQVCQQDYVNVNALDAHGVPITDLTAANFRALYRGQPAKILSASFREDPTVRTVILLSTSLFMAGSGPQGSNKWKIARSAASEFISAAPPQAPVSLVTFSDGFIRQAFQSSGGRQPMVAWLNSPATLKGLPAITKTLSEILKAMEPTHPGDAIYLITDDHKFDPAASFSRVAGELQSSGVRLFAFLLNDVGGLDLYTSAEGNRLSPVLQRHMGSGDVSDLVQNSGGLGFAWSPGFRSVSFSAKGFDYNENTLAAIRTIDHGIEAAIDNFYILAVSPPGDPAATDEWKVEVVDAEGKKRNDVTLAYPGKLAGCGSNPH